jgi:membrane protein implicated in regulation of membrane protease activity
MCGDMLLVSAMLLLLVLHALPETWGLALVASALAFELVEKTVLVAWSRRQPVAAGTEAMLGGRARVVAAGRVRYGSESWKARCSDGPADVGDTVVIDAVDGLTLVVRHIAARAKMSA